MNRKEEIIDEALAALGISMDMETDPLLMQEIMEEFQLHDFQTTHPVMKKFLVDCTKYPHELRPMFENIKAGIATKHPAIVEFLEVALKNNWLRSSSRVTYGIHVTYLLEAMTAAMCNSHSFFIEAQNHYKTVAKKQGIDPKHMLRTFARVFQVTHDMFGPLKMLSLDTLMILYRLQKGLSATHLTRTELRALRKNGQINYAEYKLLSPMHHKGLEHVIELGRINIYEAGMAEYRKGYHDNALCAHELAHDCTVKPPATYFKDIHVVPDYTKNDFYESLKSTKNMFPTVNISDEWMKLYETWNLAFVLGNIKNPDIIIPKLLIPSVISATHETYMGTRVIALWLSIHHYLFRDYAKKKCNHPEYHTEMAQAWGNINKKYALELAEKETHEDPATLYKSYHHFFAHPFFNLFKIVRNFY